MSVCQQNANSGVCLSIGCKTVVSVCQQDVKQLFACLQDINSGVCLSTGCKTAVSVCPQDVKQRCLFVYRM